MSAPESPRNGLVFDLAAIEREMRQEDAYTKGGHTARTLVRTPDQRIVFIVMKDGARLAEHQASESASLNVVVGHVRLHLPDRVVDLGKNQLLVLAGGIRHDVEATSDSSFVLTLSWHGNQ
jgi:quercetin dioxygenase-like cupin family protein